MQRVGITLIATLLLSGCGSRGPEGSVDATPLFEFRLVEPEPAAGTMTVEYQGSVLHLDPQPVVSDTDIISVEGPEEQQDRMIFSVELTADGSARFAGATRDNVGSSMAVLVDGQVASAVVIHSAAGGPLVQVAIPRDLAIAVDLPSRVRARWPTDHEF